MSVNRIYSGHFAWSRQLRRDGTAGTVPDGSQVPIGNRFFNLKTDFLWNETSQVISSKMTVQGGACIGTV